MNKKQALRAKKIIDMWLKKEEKKYKKYKIEYSVTTSVKESPSTKDWYGVIISTDDQAYDDLYSDEGFYVDKFDAEEFGIKQGSSSGTRSLLQDFVNKKMKFNSYDHYLENKGAGVISYY